MAFPLKLASLLSGATRHQLNAWRASGLVVPEIRPFRPPLYSFRDLILLRSIAFLRAETSSQKVHKAFANLSLLEITSHPSRYQFGTDGTTIWIGLDGGQAVDLVQRVGQIDLFTFEDLTSEFVNFRGTTVPNFDRPADHVQVRYRRMGGWPTIEETRVPYDTVANLVDYRTVFPDDVHHYYPGVTAEAAESAVGFNRQVEEAAA
ncbi:DUF433 domain-containing protein [Isoptericola halotolerans]|uniref:DUF433 domain-containing protein n=1 Tax=Isoptericola halotolerans TaxID=300560 RepID=UPI003890D21F